MFWGLRECRTINFLPIQQAELSIECAGARLTKVIKNVQKNPNFEYTPTDSDKYKLVVVSQTFRTQSFNFLDWFRVYHRIKISGPISASIVSKIEFLE